MKFQKINFKDAIESKQSRLGGNTFLENQSDWPSDPESKAPLLLLLTLEDDFLVSLYPDLIIPDDYCISIFTCFDASSRKCIRRLAIQQQSYISKLGNGASRVILHKRASKPCTQPAGIPAAITEVGLTRGPIEVEQIDPALPDRGTIFSKLGGIPGWAQDPIDIPGQTFVLQISEADFWPKSPAHAGMLGSDTGFLFLKQSLAPGEVGTFFIQFA